MLVTMKALNSYMNEYDRRNRVVKQTTAAGHEFLFFYDDKNKQTVFSELNAGERTVYSYDAREVVTGISYEDGTTERFEYDRWENCIYHQDRNGNETYYTYDVYGNQLEERQPGGLIITREYDRNHNIIHQAKQSF